MRSPGVWRAELRRPILMAAGVAGERARPLTFIQVSPSRRLPLFWHRRSLVALSSDVKLHEEALGRGYGKVCFTCPPVRVGNFPPGIPCSADFRLRPVRANQRRARGSAGLRVLPAYASANRLRAARKNFSLMFCNLANLDFCHVNKLAGRLFSSLLQSLFFFYFLLLILLTTILFWNACTSSRQVICKLVWLRPVCKCTVY